MLYNIISNDHRFVLKLHLSKFVNRCAELNRREVDEKAEHLRLLSWLTGLITSFTMTTPVEFNYNSAVSTVHDLPLSFANKLL